MYGRTVNTGDILQSEAEKFIVEGLNYVSGVSECEGRLGTPGSASAWGNTPLNEFQVSIV